MGGLFAGLRRGRGGGGWLLQKVQETSQWLLTVRGGAAYIRVTNEGGSPLATKKFASKEPLLREIKRAA